MNYLRSRGRIAAVIVCSAALTACTLLLNSSVEEQCSTDADCVARGPAFAGSVCTPQRVCTSPAAAKDDGGDVDAPDQTGCTSNKECIERNGNQPYTCRKADRRCVSLLSTTCDRIYAQKADLESDEAVYIGFMSVGRTGNTASVGLQEEAGAELAQREIARGTAGLPPSASGRPRRPLVLISCDELADSAASVSYLVDEIRVPAILGPALSNNFIAATATTIAKDVLLMSTTASSPLIAGLDKKGLVYSVNPSDALAADAWVKYLAEIEPRLKDDVTGGGPLKVMVLQRGDGLGIGMVNVINSKIRFNNGKTAAQNDQDGNFRVFNYGDPFDKVNNPNPEQKYNEAAIALANFKPHFVIGAGTSEIPEHILTKVEQDLWDEPGYRPFYIGVRGLETPALMALMQASEDDAGSKRTFRNRIVTTGFGTAGSTVFANFQLRYKAEFPDPSTIPPGQYAAQAYDSVYLISFAIAGAGEEPLTGSRISAGLLKTQPAQPAPPKVDVGPDSVSNAFIDLTNGKQLDINGASGPLDIDQASGVVTTDVQLRCPNVDGSGKPIGWKDSGRYLSTDTGELTGTMNCPQ